MVVDSYSTAAEEGKVAEPPSPLRLLQELMSEIHRLPVDVAVAPPPKAPWSMVAIRNQQDDGCNNPFPPINHENLQILTDPSPNANQIPHLHSGNQRLSFSDSDSFSVSDSDSNSSSTFSPSDSSSSPHSPLFSDRRAADVGGWFDSWMEILYAKVSGLVRLFCSSFASSRGVFLTFRSAAFTAVLMAFLYFRRRRSLRAGEESRKMLIGIIKDRDEKINQLLDQISRMNQVLLTLHRVPTRSTP